MNRFSILVLAVYGFFLMAFQPAVGFVWGIGVTVVGTVWWRLTRGTSDRMGQRWGRFFMALGALLLVASAALGLFRAL